MDLSLNSLFSEVNSTELLQIAQRAGIFVKPGTPRDEVVGYLLGVLQQSTNTTNVDEWRAGICAFIFEYWASLRSQIDCPAKELGSLLEHAGAPNKWLPMVSNPRAPIACFGCTDQRVMSCLVTVGKEGFAEISKCRQKVQRDPIMTAINGQYTVNSAPRDVSQIEKLGRYGMRRLATELGMFGSLTSPDHDRVSAFLAKDSSAAALEIYNALIAYDAQNPGAARPAAPAAPAAPPPAAAPPAPAAQVLPPPAAAPAAPAAEAPATKSGRKPRNSSLGAGAPAAPPAAAAPPPPAPVAQAAPAPTASAPSANIEGTLEGLYATLRQINSNLAAIAQKLDQQQTSDQAVAEVVVLTSGMLGVLCEASLSDSLGNILKDASNASEEVVQHVSSSGKKAGG